MAGLDSTDKLRLFVYDGSWIELTQRIRATITAIDDTAKTVTFNTITKDLGGTLTLATNALQNWVAYVSGKTPAFILSSTATSSGSSTITLPNKATAALTWVASGEVIFHRTTGILPESAFLPTGGGFQFSNGVTPHTRWLGVEAQSKVNLYYGYNNGTSLPPTMRQPIQIKKHGSARSFFYATSTPAYTLGTG